ncbi:hypothetical protein Tco_0794013 [Tanacetum coccineum]
MGCDGENDDMLRIRVQEAESEEEIFTSMAWIRAFNINELIYAKLYHEFYFTYEFDEFARRLGLYQAVELEEDGFNVYFEGGLRSEDNFNAADYWLSISREENLGCLGRLRNQNGYANVAWVIPKWIKRKGSGTQKESQIYCGQFISKLARKCKVLTEDVVRSLSALIYCRDLDTSDHLGVLDRFDGSKVKKMTNDAKEIQLNALTVMIALVISISSDLSNESVGSSISQVILIGSIFVKVPVAPEVRAAAVDSPARVLELDTHSSSESDPSKSSLPPVSIAPMVSPFLCSDDSASDTEIPERHVSPIPHDAMLTRICRRQAILIRPGQDIPIGRIYRTHPGGPCRALTTRKSVRPLPSHNHSSSGHSTSGHSVSGHTPPVITIADSSAPSRFVSPSLARTSRYSEVYRC